MNGQSTWPNYSQTIQQRSLLACPLKVTNAKELRTQIFRTLSQAHSEGVLNTKLTEIYGILKMSSQSQQQVVILGGLKKSGTKNFGRWSPISFAS